MTDAAYALRILRNAMDSFTDLIGSYPRSSLLIGNGYSIAAHHGFSYASLLSMTNFELEHWFKDLFSKLDTNNFELILEILDNAQFVNETSGNIAEAERDVKARENLIDLFIKTLRSIHPDNKILIDAPACITEEQYKTNGQFLNNFSTIFTLNYDLLLYWSILENKYTDRFKDNFSITKDRDYFANYFNESPIVNTNLWFLHGALHLRTDHTGLTYKVIHSENNNILDQLRASLEKSIYPTIIFEGTDKEKILKINTNRYLSIANSVLSNSSGCLFTYGFSFNKNDFHILDSIFKSSIHTLCVGLRGTTDQHQEIVGECAKLKEYAGRSFGSNRRTTPLEIFYYDTTQMNNIW